MMTFVLATNVLVTIVHISNISSVIDPIMTQYFGALIFFQIFF